jgi:hypothetical protein
MLVNNTAKNHRCLRVYPRDFVSVANIWPEPELPNGYNVIYDLFSLMLVNNVVNPQISKGLL